MDFGELLRGYKMERKLSKSSDCKEICRQVTSKILTIDFLFSLGAIPLVRTMLSHLIVVVVTGATGGVA